MTAMHGLALKGVGRGRRDHDAATRQAMGPGACVGEDGRHAGPLKGLEHLAAGAI